jgi:hypothetical protein
MRLTIYNADGVGVSESGSSPRPSPSRMRGTRRGRIYRVAGHWAVAGALCHYVKFEKRPMKMRKLNQIKPNKTMKDLDTNEVQMVLDLWAEVAGESGIAATSRSYGTPQSKTLRIGQASTVTTEI